MKGNNVIKTDPPQTASVSGTIDRYNPQSDTAPIYKTVTEWIRHGVGRNGHEAALIFDQKLSYKQLDEWTNQVAHYLIDRGVESGDRVGVCMDRSVEMIACILGILKSGAAYVPLDPHYPQGRLEMMKKDADVRLLITHTNYFDRFKSTKDRVVAWQSIQEVIKTFPALNPSVSITGEDVAYVIFTSGSTGRPKGIAMPHRALANLIEWQLERSYFKAGARVIQYSSISFDVSFQEIATTLASGGTLFLIKDDERRDPRILLQKIKEWKIERLFIPFVALRSLIEVARAKNDLPVSLKEVITAGEQLRVDDAVRDFFNQLPGAVLDNQYGPSETHVISAHLLSANPLEWPDLPPIGTPLKNSSIYLLDEKMQPVKEGETGELYLGGRNVALGYIGRDDLSSKSFIQNPFDKLNRTVLYKTGDLGRYNNDGSIDFLGRSDHQIKIRGHRIEPGEINMAGAKFPGVAHCFTQALFDTTGNTQLVIYYVCRSEMEVNEKTFKAHLLQSLPAYMVPAFIIPIEKIPYTPSGKVDVKALPKPQPADLGLLTKDKIKYETETEVKLAKIWSIILGLETIPRTSDFFNLGGDSLLAVTLFLQIESEFGLALPLSTLVHASSLKELSLLLDNENEATDYSRFRSLQLLQKGDKSKIPLFLVHGGEGNVLVFQDFVKDLNPDQPVYAFQWSGWDGLPGESDILGMAASYKNELRKACPIGPYRIGGYCVGGVIAIEIANMLKAEGAEVLDPILIVDSPNLHSRHFRPKEPEAYEQELLAFKAFRKELASKIPREIKELTFKKKNSIKNNNQSENLSFPRRLLKPFKKMSFYDPVRKFLFNCYHVVTYPILHTNEFKSGLIIFFYPLFSKSIPIQYRAYYCGTTLVAAIKKHKKTVYDGDILYLRSELVHGRHLGLQGWWDDLFMGFRELCTGHFDAHVVGGGHNDVLKYSYTHKIVKEKMLSDS